MGLIKEFKEFAMKGNVIDLAVGVVIGGAFQGIVNSLVKDIIMPLTALFTGSVDYSNWKIVIAGGAAEIGIGSFINALINFLIIAFSIFIVLRYINKLSKKLEELNKEAMVKLNRRKDDPKDSPAVVEPAVKTCPYCLSEIPYRATKCAHCASDLSEEKIQEKAEEQV